jgi:hypothetical protein
MLRQTGGHRAPPLLFHLFSPLTVTFPKLSVILRPLYSFCRTELVSVADALVLYSDGYRLTVFVVLSSSSRMENKQVHLEILPTSY